MSKKLKFNELIADNRENALKLSAAGKEVLSNKDDNKRKILELILANKENAIALSTANKILNAQKRVIKKQEAALILANKKLAIQITEKERHAAELVIANKELVLSKEKEKLVAELILTNKELTNHISISQKAEKKLKISETRYRRLFEAAKDGILILNANNGQIEDANPFLLKMVGNTLNEIKGKELWEIGTFKNIVASKDAFKELQDNEYICFDDMLLVRNGGTQTSVEFISNVYMVDHKKVIQCNIRDITERKQYEVELIKAKKKAEESDRIKTAFLTNMSHEIRTPMNGILGFAELLKEPDISSDDQQDYLQIIQISGARMLNTINDIVNISKIESGLIQVNIDETNINEKIEFTYNFFKPEAENKKLQLSFKNGLQSKDAIIKTDNEKVYGILTNLVKNAIKFTYEGSIELGYARKGEYLEFYVKDTWIGIKQNQKETIFERFRQGSESHTRGYEGSGLGLSISKSYIEMLGGEIWVESEEGRGSTFYFTIPYNPIPEEKTVVENTFSEIDKEAQLNKLKILIVEDDEISYSLLTRILQNVNCEIFHAITGFEAVKACRTNPGLDLILMDIRMPGMDGFEATRQIRQFNKDVIIIAQTAYAFTGDKEKALEAGCNSYITKPINKTLLTEIIKSYFN